MRKIVPLLGMLVLWSAFSLAQNKTITGKVTDDNGKPLEGVSVVDKSTKKGAVTNASGAFSLPANTGTTVVFSAIGFSNKEVTVGSGNEVNISLTAISAQLNEVVVTALGIKREKKALGYAVSTVEKKDLELRPEGDLGRVLNGKAPGLNVINTSGLTGSGTNIVIRGVSSITGSSQPLFIVDGVPFNVNTNAQADFTYGNQTSSRFLDLDPNNIESVNVLKGLSATTLYGEEGRNGVILITTKTGSTQKPKAKQEISVTQSLFANTVSNLPDYEHTWGGGFDLSLGVTFFSNWGAKITNPPAIVAHPYDRDAINQDFKDAQGNPIFLGAPYEYKFYNSVENFFRTGLVSNTSVNVAGSAGVLNYNVNYSYLDDEGFTPGNNEIRNTFGVGGTAKLSNKFTVSGSLNYVTNNVASPPTSTSFGSSATNTSVFGDVMYTPVTVDLMGLPYQDPVTGGHVYYRSANDIQNPRWTVANSFTKDNVNRNYGNLQFLYNITKGLNLTYRVGFDNYTESQLYAQNKGGAYYSTGIYRTSAGNNVIWNHQLIADYNTLFGEKWSLSVTAGADATQQTYKQTGYTSTQQLVFGLLDHSNFITHDTKSENGVDLDFTNATKTYAGFAQAILGYNDYLFFNLGGRNSWTSTLEANNRSLFYPSASVSFIPTSALAFLQNSKNINYLKVRLGYGTSARFPDPYSTRSVLDINTRAFLDRNGTAINTNSISDLLANPDLKPELQKEVEAGLEGRFFDNRVNMDLTFYKRTTNDQILFRELDPSTGYTLEAINAGNVTNKGIELALGYTVIRNKNWTWHLDGLYDLNRSKVTDLPDDLKQVLIAGYTTLGNFAINGQPYGVIQSNYVVRDTAAGSKGFGQRVVDQTGAYLISPDIKVTGDPNPLYKLTGISTLTYKSLSFRMQWEFTEGGAYYSSTTVNLVGRGVTEETDFDRTLPMILPGVKQDGTPNNIQVSATAAFFNNLVGSTSDLAIYDATLVRLREASLSYVLPEKWLAKTPLGSLTLSFSGTNLWYEAPNFPKHVHFDPEATGFGVSNGRGLEFFSGPSSRRFGGSIRVTF